MSIVVGTVLDVWGWVSGKVPDVLTDGIGRITELGHHRAGGVVSSNM